jgi:cellulose synthase/poly-beta-1,6-N-acetylglucosamine synthase-like glycosyltransferase
VVLPTVTFIIPKRPGAPAPAALDGIAGLDYPREKIEILVVEGENVSRQRNQAIAAARGEILYFLDDDSVLDRRAMRRLCECLVEHPQAAEIMVVGGPVLHRPGPTVFTRAVGAAMSSVFGFGPYRHRYLANGLPRDTDERQLIAANMAVRREVFADPQAFDERLYCNEENELLARFKARGVRMFYHPLLVAWRDPRASFGALAAQLGRYGRGRLRHMLIHPPSRELMPFAPLAVLTALLAALLSRQLLALVPVALYLQLAFYASAFIAWLHRPRFRLFILLMAVFPVMHLAYAAGMVAGIGEWLLRLELRARESQPRITVVQPLPGRPQIAA